MAMPTQKSALTAFQVFCATVREDLRKENPKICPMDLGKLFFERWKALPDEKKQVFILEAKHHEPFARHILDDPKWKKHASGGGGASKKRKKADGAPKKPRGAWTYFCQELRPELKAKNPEAPFGDINKMLSAQWRTIKDRRKFDKKAEEDKVRYKKEYDIWKKLQAEKEKEAEEPPVKKARTS